MDFLYSSENEYECDIRAVQAARRLYERSWSQGRLNRFWRTMTRRSRHLLDLTTIARDNNIQTRHYLGTQTVSIKQIRGSEGRSGDFDALFYPRKRYSRERWLSIAAARLMHSALPPVELIQVGADYFVRDGHHRISVAQALDEQYIEADVTVWQVSKPLPQKQPLSPALPQPAVICRQVYQKGSLLKSLSSRSD
jgi:hypothetical protein